MSLTQETIAEKLGVSRRAVGFALADDPRSQKQLAATTRRRIREVARELGYRPHRQAQLLRGVKSGLIGVIKPTGMLQVAIERSFHISRAIQAAGYGLLVNELHWDELGEQRSVNTMLDERVEGVLLDGVGWAGDAIMPELQRLRAAQIPVVGLGGTVQLGFPTVVADFRQGMAALTRHLLTLGYRKLMLVCPLNPADLSLPQFSGQAERVAGFRETAAAAGLSAAQAPVLHQPNTTGWRDEHAPGRAAVARLAATGDRPEVLLCSNDLIAVGALTGCVARGWRVPQDLAITGFDNTTLGEYCVPALTSVAQPTDAIVRQAVELLLKQIRGETISTSTTLVKLPCQLVVRQSCGKPTR